MELAVILVVGLVVTIDVWVRDLLDHLTGR
jgi:hypothetical protein